MERRHFLQGTGLAAAMLPLPVLALADGPTIRWRLASSFPKSLDTIFDAANTVARRVAVATGGRFQIQVFAAGELVPGPGVFDAVKEGTVPIGHTSSYYYIGKNPAFAFDTAMPFGLNSRQQTAWMMQGGGLALMRELFRPHNIVNIPCGNTGAQMGGWYRKEIKTLADLKGLKFRVGGLTGQVLARLGVVPQQIPGNEVYQALEKGALDAAEWVGPYDDEKLGFNKVARYYYFPGWWEGGPQLSLYVNAKEWASLPPEYRTILEDACLYAHADMQAAYDVKNPPALRRLIQSGTQLRRFPDEIMQAGYQAAREIYQENAAKHPDFQKVYEAWLKFRNEQVAWFGIAERPFDNFMAVAGRVAPQGRQD